MPFLLTNDTELENLPSIKTLKVFDKHPRLGLLSPCSNTWGERFLLQKIYQIFWFIHNNAYFVKDFVKAVAIMMKLITCIFIWWK